MSETIYGVINHGIIVFADERSEVIITINKDQLDWWEVTGNGGRYALVDHSLHNYIVSVMPIGLAQLLAQNWFKDKTLDLDIEVDPGDYFVK